MKGTLYQEGQQSSVSDDILSGCLGSIVMLFRYIAYLASAALVLPQLFTH